MLARWFNSQEVRFPRPDQFASGASPNAIKLRPAFALGAPAIPAAVGGLAPAFKGPPGLELLAIAPEPEEAELERIPDGLVVSGGRKEEIDDAVGNDPAIEAQWRLLDALSIPCRCDGVWLVQTMQDASSGLEFTR